MNINLFRQELPDHYSDLLYPRCFSKPEYNIANNDLPSGNTTMFIGHMLNFAVSLMEPGEAHLQLGNDCALTLDYAMRGNLDKYFYLIAHFVFDDEWEGYLHQWLQKHPEYAGRLSVFRREFFRNLFSESLNLKHKIGVCFYDALPYYKIIFRTLKFIEPFLADNALIIINNANWEDAREAMEDWLNDNSQGFLIYDLPTPTSDHPTWWNGISVVGYTRNN